MDVRVSKQQGTLRKDGVTAVEGAVNVKIYYELPNSVDIETRKKIETILNDAEKAMKDDISHALQGQQ